MRLSSYKCIWIIVPYILIAGGLNCVLNPPSPCETDAECDDGQSCTEDSCTDLFCRNTAIVCAEGQICVPASGVCEDGECAIHGHCDDGVFAMAWSRAILCHAPAAPDLCLAGKIRFVRKYRADAGMSNVWLTQTATTATTAQRIHVLTIWPVATSNWNVRMVRFVSS